MTITTLAAASTATPAAGSSSEAFDAELLAMLKQGIVARKGMVFHVQGAEINGVVKEIRQGAVLVSNHEHGRILIRIDRIDAVEGD